MNPLGNYALISRPTELDFLINDIVSPDFPIEKTISYLAYYYPKLKNSKNVELLTLNLFKSQIFSNLGLLSIDKAAKLIECFQYVVTEKFKITNPTVSFIDFYKSIYNAICYQMRTDPEAYWKVIPVLTGCISALPQMMRYNPYPAYSNVLHKTHKLYLELYANTIVPVFNLNLLNNFKDPFLLSLSYIQEYFEDPLLRSLMLASPTMLSDINKLLFTSTEGLNNSTTFLSDLTYQDLMKNTPVLRLLNKWAFLYSKLAKHASLQQAADSLVFITEFSSNIVKSLETIKNSTDKWDLVKYCFFSIVIMFENLMGVILTNKVVLTAQYVIFNQIHRVLFNLSFILDQIGTGGFDSYNFVFDTSTSLFQKDPQLVTNLAYSFLNELSFTNPSQNTIEKSKLDYFLCWTEALLPALDELFLSSSLLPLLQKILKTNTFAISTVEFAHSIMIKYISLNDASPFIYSYFERALTQFPEILSLHQASLIAQTCAAKCDSATTLFDLVKFHISVSSYTPLPPRKTLNAGYEVIVSETLNTRKAGLISLLIDVCQYVEPSNFVFSLSEIKSLIDNLIGDRDIYKLYDLLWDKILMINKIDTWKGQTGIAWWYDNVNNGQVPHL